MRAYPLDATTSATSSAERGGVMRLLYLQGIGESANAVIIVADKVVSIHPRMVGVDFNAVLETYDTYKVEGTTIICVGEAYIVANEFADVLKMLEQQPTERSE